MTETPSPLRVTVNGDRVDLPTGATVADLVARLCPSPRGVAVAVNREVVPRSAWKSSAVPDGAVIEIVGAAAGG